MSSETRFSSFEQRSLERQLSQWETVLSELEETASTPSPFRSLPLEWATAKGIRLWSKQKEILASVRDNPVTVVHSCTTVGKSFCAATSACWWIDVHPPHLTRVVSTAPTGDQVKGILWQEIAMIARRAKLAGRVNQRDWWVAERQVGLGRKPSEYSTSVFQGYHATYLLLIVDEAAGVPKSLFDDVSTLVSGEHCRLLVIGNPDDPTSEFAHLCRESSNAEVIHISAFDSPNFTGEEVEPELAEALISERFVRAKRDEWGETSAMYVAKVMGLFPETTSEGVVPYGWVQRCRETDPFPVAGPVEAGLDVGQGKPDRTVLRERRGQRAGRERIWTDPDAMAQADDIAATLAKWGVQRVKVDVTGGHGWGIADRLKQLSGRQNAPGRLRGETTHDAEVVDINFGGRPKDPKQFANVRAELYWEARELSRLRAWDLSDPSVDDDTIAEITAMRRKIADAKAVIQLEPKENVIQRLRRSPDRGEALLLAFYDPGNEAQIADAAALTSERAYTP